MKYKIETGVRVKVMVDFGPRTYFSSLDSLFGCNVILITGYRVKMMGQRPIF